MPAIIMGILATVLLGVAGVVASHGHRSLSIWITFVSVILYAFIAFKAWDDSFEKPRSNADSTEQRPWVVVSAIQLTRPLAVGEPPNVVVELYNSGKTPALGLRIIAVTYSREELLPPPYFIENPNMKIGSDAVLGPNVHMTSNAHINEVIQTQEQIDAISKATFKLFCVGRITYNDVYKNSHKTTFCYQISGAGLTPKVGQVRNVVLPVV